MPLLIGSFLIFCVLLDSFVTFGYSNELVANVLNSVANFFSVNCIYFITSSSESDITIQRLALSVCLDFGKSVASSNFSQYHNLVKNAEREQCQVPLRVIFQLNETTVSKDLEEFNWLYMNYSDKISSGVWMVFMKSFQDQFVAEFFQKIFLPFDIEVIVAWIDNEMVHLKEVYQVAPSHSLRQAYFGNYTLEAGLVSQMCLCDRRWTDLEGLQLKVGYIDNNLPFTVSRSTERKDSLGGYFGEIWQALEDLMNISSTYVKVELRREKDENKNSWLYVMKMLREKKIDAGLGDFIPSTSRVEYLDFSYPLLVSNFQVFYKNSPKDRRLHGYLIPFGNDIWLTLLIWTFINSLCYFCFTLIRKRYIQNTEKIISTTASIFMTFGGLCGQGYSNPARFLSSKMLFLLTSIVATVVIPSYSASLTRYLTSKPLEVVIKDLNDLYNRASHKVIVVDGSFEYYFFNFNRSNENMRKINAEYTENEILPKSYKEAILWACQEKNTAVFTVTSTLIWELNKPENAKLKDECDLKKMTQNAGMLINGIIYPKNSRFRKLIDHHLKNLQKSGIIDRLQKKYWKKQPSFGIKQWKSVNLQYSSALFQIIICGAGLSFVIIILEQIIKKRIIMKPEK